jgi:hypothetical protein
MKEIVPEKHAVVGSTEDRSVSALELMLIVDFTGNRWFN